MGNQNLVPVLVTFDTTSANQNHVPVLISLTPADSLLSTTSINGKATGATLLFTVPAGKTAIVTKAQLHMTSASNVTGVATVSIGKTTAEWQDIIAEIALTGFDTTGMVATLTPIALTAVSTAAAGTIKIDVDAAATTTGGDDTYTFNVYLYGYLI